MSTADRCDLCGRAEETTRHHLIPRTRHKNRKNKKTFDRREVHERVAWLCRACHKMVHATLTEKQLEQEFNTLESLQAHPEIAKFVKWVRRQPPGQHVRVHSSGDIRQARQAVRDRR